MGVNLWDIAALSRAEFSRFPLFLFSALTLLAPAHAAYAETRLINAEQEGEDVELITIQGRNLPAEQAPLAASSVSGAVLEAYGASTYSEASAFFPGFGVQEQSPAIPGFVMRGVTTDSGAAFMESRIGLFRDGVPASRNRGAYTELFDIERIEVLRGPQPTLFGRNAMTGAVNVVEHKAEFSETSGFLEGAVGSNQFQRALGVFNWGPAEGFAAARIAGTLRQGDGFTDNDLGGDALGAYRVQAGRAAFAFAPDARFRADLILNVHEDDNAGAAFKSGTFAPQHGDLGFFSHAALNRSVAGFEGGRDIGLDRQVESATLVAEWRLSPSLKLSSLSNYRDFDLIDLFDADGAPVPLLFGSERTEAEQWSQELRLVLDGAGAVSGFAGVSFINERGSQKVSTVYNEHFFLPMLLGLMRGPQSLTQTEADALSFAGLTAAPSSGGLGLPSGTANALISNLATVHSEYYENASDVQSLDVFADFTLAVNDRLDLSAGMRYSHDDKTSTLEAGLLNGGSPLGATLANLFGIPLSAPPGLFIQPQPNIAEDGRFDGFSWRLAGAYDATDAVVLWAALAHGRTPNVIAMNSGNLPGSHAAIEILPEETLQSVEFGLHAHAFDEALRLGVSLYDYSYEDFQTTQIVNGTFRSVNAGRAHAYGLEAELQWRIFDAWSLIGAYAYNHARFTSGAREGNHFRLAPDHRASLGLSYQRSIEYLGVFYLNAFYDWRSKVFFDNDNDRRELQPPLLASVPTLRDQAVDEYQEAYGLLALRLGVSSDAQTWRAGVFVDNALDESYLLDAGNVGDSFTFPTFIRGAGRIWGMELSRMF